MMKKSLVLGSLLSTVCLASADAHTGYFKSGFLAGGHVGVGFGNGKFNSTYSVPVATSSSTGSASKTAPLFGVFGGYRHVTHEGYVLGLALEANLSGSSELKKEFRHFNLLTVDNLLKRSFSVVPVLRFGKIFCGRYLASIGLGMPITRFKQQANIITLGALSNSSATYTKVGFAPSLGLEYAASRNASIFTNVSYEMYGKVSKTFGSEFGQNATYSSSIKPNAIVLKVGASYRF